jgi:hypothetical protein
MNVMIAWNIMASFSYLIMALPNVLGHALNLSAADPPSYTSSSSLALHFLLHFW